jgi:hypothetical protein
VKILPLHFYIHPKIPVYGDRRIDSIVEKVGRKEGRKEGKEDKTKEMDRKL